MDAVHLRPVEPERDFGQLAALFTTEQDEPTTETGLRDDHAAHKDRIFRLMAAENECGELLGFNWATISRFEASQANIYIIVKPEQRQRGVGSRLYDDVEQAAPQAGVQTLRAEVRDTCPDFQAFAEKRGFNERSHSWGMSLDLKGFDDQPYEPLIEKLKSEGFQFTSMEALGNTETAQRKLYALNEMTNRETLGSDGSPAWQSFEDFREKVCGSDWYQPAGQMVVIDTASGEWAAMSAITRFNGADYAYNLFTGVDQRYRGRKLAQVVKILALRYARDVLKVDTVRTNHNSKNAPMIAIDRKFGYVQSPGLFSMEKTLH